MATQGGPCEMCGVMGWDQFILTCEKCGTRKHQYCTEVLLMEAPDNWTCEECRLNIKEIPVIPNQQKDSPGAKEVENNKRGKDTTRSLNTVKRKKVKYLPLEDVLKMSLGEREGSQIQTRRKDNPLMRQTNKARSPLQAKDLVREPTQHVTAEKPHKINPALIGEVSTLQKEASKKMMPSASTIARARGGLPGDNLSTVATDKGDLQKKDALSDAITSADIYRLHFPSEWVTWTGRFKFPNDTSADRCGDLVFDGVSPGRVSPNAFECSLNLPPDLHVEHIPLKRLVTNLFPNSNPDLRDIGIYFATEDASYRSFQTYKNLVECLLSKEFALRCCLDGAELFIFTSNILNSDSQLLVTSGLTNKYFLWGVYCSTRSRGDGSSSRKELFSDSALHEDENEHRLRQDISSAEPIIAGCDGMKKTVPVSEPSPVEKAGESFGLVSSEGFTENVKVKGQALPTAIQEPRPKPPSDMLMSEQSTNLKNRVMLNTSSAWRSEKGTAGAGGFIENVKVEGQALPTAIQEPRPKPPYDMLIAEQSTNLKNWVMLNTSSAWRSGKGIAGAGGFTENVKVKGQALPTAIQEPRPKPPSDMLMSEQSTNLKNRVMLNTSSTWRSEKGTAGAGGFTENVKVEGRALPTAIQKPSPKPSSDMLIAEQSTNLKNWAMLNTSSAWRSEKGTAGAGGFIENVKVEGQALPTAIQEPRPQPPSDMLIAEQSTNLKNRVMLNTSFAWRSEKGTAGAGGFIENVKVEGQALPTANQEPRPKPPSDMLIAEQSTNLKNRVMLNTSFAWRSEKGTAGAGGFIENVKVEGQALPTTSQEPRPKPPYDMLIAEQSTNLKNRVMLNTSSAWRSEKGIAGAGGFTENVKVKGQALPTAIQEPRPKPPSDMLMSEQSTNLKNRVMLNTSSAWRSEKGIAGAGRFTENVKVKGQALPTAIQEPRPKPPSDMLMSEQSTNLKNRVMLNTSAAWRSEKGTAGAGGFIENVKVKGQALPTAIQEPRPKPPSDMLISEQSTNLKNWVMLNTSSAWRSEKGTAGAGGIISTSSGKWVCGFVINLGKCEKQKADLWSLFQGLLSLWEQGYRAVNVKSDSSALSLLNTAPSPVDPNSQLIIGCRDILVRDWKCIWGHIKVEENVAAHRLADIFESYAHGPTFLQAPPPELTCFFKGKDC